MSAALSLAPTDTKSKATSIVLGLPEYRRIKSAIAKDAGIELGDDKVSLVHARLQKRLRKIGLDCFKEYCDLIESNDGNDERKLMLNALTASKYDIKILASDIDQNMIETARLGMYSANLMEHMPAKLKNKFFEASEGARDITYTAKSTIRSLITFRELNLNAASWPMRGKFDIIFCRNTVIYFNAATYDYGLSKTIMAS